MGLTAKPIKKDKSNYIKMQNKLDRNKKLDKIYKEANKKSLSSEE